MECIKLSGGNRLYGAVDIQGSKNAVLPVLAATILNGGKNVIHNCPDLSDVRTTVEILKFLGCSVEREGGTITVDSSHLTNNFIPHELMNKMRSSIIFMGAIIARQKSAVMSFPGGCELGPRPIDLHIKALRALGVDVKESHGYIHCNADKIAPTQIQLDFPSVGATENIMLVSVLSDGVTTIVNAAREPEIVDLQTYLNAMGAKVSGAGTGVISIRGVKTLTDAEHSVIPDRIVASTFMTAAAITGGTIEVKKVIPQHFSAVTAVLKECGATVHTKKNSVIVTGPKRVRSVDIIRTSPYPGFPTDAQSVILSLLAVSGGTSIVKETIFENRFKHAAELLKMGADINVDGKVAIIRGVPRLTGSKVYACDLRSGAGLVIAGLRAEGETTIFNVEFIDRGYQNLHAELKKLGANIARVEE